MKTESFRCISVVIKAFALAIAALQAWGDASPIEGRSLSEKSKNTATEPIHRSAVLPPGPLAKEKHSGAETELPYLLLAGSVDRSVVLNNNLTPGYTWRISSESNVKCATVELINRKSRNGINPPESASGQTLVKVNALRPGTSHVELVYGCEGEKDTEPVRRIELKITVIPAPRNLW